MKRTIELLPLIYASALFLWFNKVYQFYFQSTLADQVSLLLAMVISFLCSRSFLKVHWSTPATIGALLILIAVPLILHPITVHLISMTDYTWVVVHFLIGLSGFLLGSMRQSKWVLLPVLGLILTQFLPYHFDENQSKYFDRVITSIDTRKGSSQIVQWKDDYWLHYNNELQYATIDAAMMKEAFVQPVMHLSDEAPLNILILGGDNGLILDELGKFENIARLTVVPLDLEMFRHLKAEKTLPELAPPHKVEVLDTNSTQSYLADSTGLFDIVFVDLPDPKKMEYRQYYTQPFYDLCTGKLTADGFLVTQSGNPHLAEQQFTETLQRIHSTGLSAIPYHAQIPSRGQCSWIIASKAMDKGDLIARLQTVEPRTQTRWWNTEAMQMMLSFGKTSYFSDL